MSHVLLAGKGKARLRSLNHMKVTLYSRMCDDKINRVELADRLGWNLNSVDLLFQHYHQSRPDQLDEAFTELGWPSSIDAIAAAMEEERGREVV